MPKFSSAQQAIGQLLWSGLWGGIIAGLTGVGTYTFTRGFDLPFLAGIFLAGFGGSFWTALTKLESNPNLVQAALDTLAEIKAVATANVAQPAVQHVVIHTVPMPVASPPVVTQPIAPPQAPAPAQPVSSPSQAPQLQFNAPQVQYNAQGIPVAVTPGSMGSSGGGLPQGFYGNPPGWSNTNAPIPQMPLDTRPYAAIQQQQGGQGR